MRKLPLLVALLLLSLLAACGPAAPAPAASAPVDAASEAAPPQRVTFLTSGDPAERAAYQTLVDRFNAAQDEVRVEVSHVPSASDYRTRLATEFAAGAPPDVTLMNYRRVAAFAANDQLEPLGPFLAKSDVISEKDFYPITIEAFRWKGTLLCLPQNISSLVVYYNQDLFDVAGVPHPSDDWTWDDFVAAAKALTRDTDGDGTVDQYGLGVEASFFRAIPFIWQNGAEIVDDPVNPTRLTILGTDAQAALHWFADLRLRHGVVPTREEEASLDSESRFLAGATAMFLNSRRGTPTYREIESFAWDVAPLPQGRVPASILHSDGYCLSRTAPNKEAAWRFIEFANSPEGQRLIAETGRTVPSLRAVAESEAFLSPDQPPARSRVFLDTIPALRYVPVISTWDEIESVAGEEVERAFYGDITVDEAARNATTRTEEYFLHGETAGQ